MSVRSGKGARKRLRITDARLLEAKIALVSAVEAEDFPDATARVEADLSRLPPALRV